MTSKKKPEWEVKIYGLQSDSIDVDLIVQIVAMLGRHLRSEAFEQIADKSVEPDFEDR